MDDGRAPSGWNESKKKSGTAGVIVPGEMFVPMPVIEVVLERGGVEYAEPDMSEEKSASSCGSVNISRPLAGLCVKLWYNAGGED